MNVAAHQEKEKNEKTKTGKIKAVERRRQATSFKRLKTKSCLSAIVQGAARRKNSLCEGSARSDWDPWEGQKPFRPKPNGAEDRITTLRRLLIAVDLVLVKKLCIYFSAYAIFSLPGRF